MSDSGIPRDPKYPRVLDFDLLRREGIKHIQRLGSDLWTDYNPHDPGITLLEALCYAINDLGYRCAFPMQDLLAPPDDAPAESREDVGSLFSARQILPCSPVTLLDWRKLIVDVPLVKNAWVRKVATEATRPFYLDDKTSSLSFRQSKNEDVSIDVQGVYGVQLQLGRDASLGDLNDNSIPWRPQLVDGPRTMVDLVFPPWQRWRKPGAAPETHLALADDPWLRPDGTLEIAVAASPAPQLRYTTDANDSHLELDLQATVFVDGKASTKILRGVKLFLRDDPKSVGQYKDALLAQLASDKQPAQLYRQRLAAAFRVVGAVIDVLNRHRPVCEDFLEPSAAEFVEIAVCAEVDVDPEADLEAIAAELFLALDQMWSPPIRFHSLAEMLSAGTPVEQIFEGPPLEHGFIRDEEMAASEPPEAIHDSDVMRVIMERQGVMAVRKLALSMFDEQGHPLPSTTLSKNSDRPTALPRFATDKSRLIFYKNNVPFRLQANELAQKIAFLAGREGIGETGLEPVPVDLPYPQGRAPGLAEYCPVRDDLPRTYGVEPEGLPDSADPQRKAQAEQLKAYLLLFDTLLANYLAQLAHTRELFLLKTRTGGSGEAKYDLPTTFAAPLASDPAFKGLFKEGAAVALSDPSSGRDLIADQDQVLLDRRNRILDHLLARFNERFSEYAAIVADLAHARPLETARNLVRAKAEFLIEYPEISKNRGRGFDHHDRRRIFTPDNISGFERRLARLLGISLDGPRNLAPAFGQEGLVGFPSAELYQESDEDNLPELRFRVRDETGRIILSSRTKYLTRGEALSELATTVFHGRDRSAFAMKIDQSGHPYFDIVDHKGKVVARHIEYFGNQSNADAAADHIARTFRSTLRQEGFHFVEHLLLRPERACDLPDPSGETLMSITAETANSSPPARDPYSFRATLIFPCWGDRFIDRHFRQFCETTARLEAPAHVFLKICWVDIESMRRFEAAYRSWLLARAQELPGSPVLLDAKKKLINVMESLCSVYPVSRLYDCKKGGGENPVLLDHSQLGTAPEEGT